LHWIADYQSPTTLPKTYLRLESRVVWDRFDDQWGLHRGLFTISGRDCEEILKRTCSVLSQLADDPFELGLAVVER